MSLKSISEWLYNTPVSQDIQNTSWIIPTVQSIHILAISVLIGSAIVLDLKLVGFVGKDDSSVVIFRRYMPWLWWALGTLILTGIIMVVGEPERVLTNWVFWIKMVLVVIAFFVTLLLRVPLLSEDLTRMPVFWNRMMKPIGILSLAIWIAIIFCGRWIAYAI